ncbi:MAG: hypothetical protein K0M70_04925 [Arenimonas sp.]|uniref:hypothetical protein n=1 Tax=Arenimonas sp. TaxID=1872635 RepID=UPI0025C36F15|nr:hypothetical protein [Arenimonas sp.]MBW8367185.1 hypothetical protein [Arenimonas sp.]
MATQHSASHLALLLFLALAGNGAAAAGTASQDTPASSATSASATVGFRIVIGEVLRFDSQVQRMPANAPQTTRIVTTQAGRRLVTLARP